MQPRGRTPGMLYNPQPIMRTGNEVGGQAQRQIYPHEILGNKLQTQVRYRECQIYGGVNLNNLGALSDAVTGAMSHVVQVPDDYAGGDIIVHMMIRGQANGTVRMDRFSYRVRGGQGLYFIETNVNTDFAISAGANSIIEKTYVLPEEAFQKLDALRLDLQRYGADGTDTLAGNIDIDLMYIEYTAYV